MCRWWRVLAWMATCIPSRIHCAAHHPQQRNNTLTLNPDPKVAAGAAAAVPLKLLSLLESHLALKHGVYNGLTLLLIQSCMGAREATCVHECICVKGHGIVVGTSIRFAYYIAVSKSNILILVKGLQSALGVPPSPHTRLYIPCGAVVLLVLGYCCSGLEAPCAL